MVTLFHRPQLRSSQRALALLKQVSAEASETATEDQASDHSHQNKIQRSAFELNVTEDAPTSDQLRSIFEYIGDKRAKDVVAGATTPSEAIKMLKEDKSRLKAPIVCLSHERQEAITDTMAGCGLE